MSYEELNNIAHQLNEQVRTLYSQVKEANMTNIFKRLDYLFKILENKESFPESFLLSCKEEIISLMTIPKNKEVTEEKQAEK